MRDAIKRAEAILFDMEEKLGHCRRFNFLKESADEINSLADKINEINFSTALSRDINDCVSRIKTLTQMMKE